MSKWQPIETAPKDGTWVMCWVPDWRNCKCASLYWSVSAWTNRNEEGQPTHWQPLLDGPSPEAEHAAHEMSTAMKVVGGEHDGQWHNVEDGLTAVVLYKFVPVPMEYGGPMPAVAGNAERVIYTVRQLAWQGPSGKLDKLFFLAPVEMTDMDAIRHQFSK